MIPPVEQLSDRDLLAHVQRAAESERLATAQLLALLMELDTRKLYLGEGCSSLFTYCTQVLHLSEHAAYGRIEAARAARRFPVILERLAEGAITLTAVGLLAPHLTAVNYIEVLDAARHKSKRDVEHLVARLHPRPDVPAVVRKLPERKTLSVVDEAPAVNEPAVAPPPPSSSPSPMVETRRAEMKPVAPERYRIQFTVGREAYDKLRCAQDLLRHTIPDGDLAAIFRSGSHAACYRTLQDQAGCHRPPACHPDASAYVTPYSSCGETCGVAARRRAVRLRRHTGPAVFRDRLSRVPSHRPVRGRWRDVD